VHAVKLMVLDGNSIINRAYYGVRPLTTRDGFFTHAIFGFLTMLGRLLDEEKPEALCVAFDRREPTFRHLEYEGYKATRHAMPEELAMQMPVLKDVLDAMNIPRYELAGFEADDLIGTISRKCESAGWDCVVATGDKDSLQLVTEYTTVKLISTRMGQTTTKDMTPESFREVYGFAPIHIVDLKALMGDASDNIPGYTGLNPRQILEGELGLPVAVENDVSAAAAGEFAFGAARDEQDFLMVSYGTGVGGAVYIGGRLWRGPVLPVQRGPVEPPELHQPARHGLQRHLRCPAGKLQPHWHHLLGPVHLPHLGGRHLPFHQVLSHGDRRPDQRHHHLPVCILHAVPRQDPEAAVQECGQDQCERRACPGGKGQREEGGQVRCCF